LRLLPLKLIIRAHSRADTGRAVNGIKSAGNGIPVKRKLFKNNHLNARGDLNPILGVLFSAIFHGVSLGNFHQGRNLWKWVEAKVWSFVVDLRTNFLCVLIIVCLSAGMWRIPV
jgi:hypothetical protein